MAVYWVRTAEITLGKDAQTLERATRIMKYMNDTFPAQPGEVWTNIGANLSDIHWVRKYESLAEVEKISAMLDADEKLQTMIKEALDGGYLRAVSDRLHRVHL